MGSPAGWWDSPPITSSVFKTPIDDLMRCRGKRRCPALLDRKRSIQVVPVHGPAFTLNTRRYSCEPVENRRTISHGLKKKQPISSSDIASAVNCEVLSRWIPSRSRKLCARWCRDYCASAPSGCGCVPRNHSVQSVLPGALATDLEQPSCWQRLSPPCAMQYCLLLLFKS